MTLRRRPGSGWPASTFTGSLTGRIPVNQIEATLRALRYDPHRVSAADWPGDLTGLGVPGLYSWWTDEPGAHDLSEGLGHAVSAGLIYAGQTGATKWPSGRVPTSTFTGRIQGTTCVDA